GPAGVRLLRPLPRQGPPRRVRLRADPPVPPRRPGTARPRQDRRGAQRRRAPLGRPGRDVRVPRPRLAAHLHPPQLGPPLSSAPSSSRRGTLRAILLSAPAPKPEEWGRLGSPPYRPRVGRGTSVN